MPVLAVSGPAAPAPPPVTVDAAAPGERTVPTRPLATGRVRGSGLATDDDVLQSVLEAVVVGRDA